ncbi:hypothetical protein GCM10009616_40290 [Microlunatus lacustris]
MPPEDSDPADQDDARLVSIAIGLLMEWQSLDAESASELLAQRASQTGLPLRSAAALVVDDAAF